jgi:hypothetical protein
MTNDRFQDDCDALARRVSEAIDGADLSTITSVAAGIAAFAIKERYEDVDERAAALMTIIQFMFRTAGFACDVDIKVHNEMLH